MSVTLFGIGLAAVLACASFVAYWYGWRITKAVFYSSTTITLGAVIIHTLSLPKILSIIVTAISCSVALFQLMLADSDATSPSDKRKLRTQEQFRSRAVFVRDDEVEEMIHRYAEALAKKESKASETGDKWERELGDALRR